VRKPEIPAIIDKLLVANRGEIAVRIIRACRELGISPVALYSDADRTSLHVRMADEAYRIGPPPSSESYLCIDRIIEAAEACGARAVHPGYGFLAENPEFSQACADAGLIFVGPSAESMRIMGRKTEARSVLRNSGVLLVPGTCRPLASLREAAEEARIIGYPVMIKAAAGGGGKGMRLVREETRLAADFETARSEALSSFGDAAVYLEKYIARPRHVEIQVLLDKHGNGIHLGERECSVQRRHQKIIEECPSPLVDDELRARMGAAALRVARSVNYENAGTVEFLVDDNRNFYFLEMNTRLQVEHPVTEAVTGLDLVHEQLRIAAGAGLGLTQEEVRWCGWAVECRVCAEDPLNDFMPAPGTIRDLAEPQGPGVRIDSGIYNGWQVPVHYDPLIAKLVVWAPNRRLAIQRMRRAMGEYRILGLKTNLHFLAQVLRDSEFVEGRLTTNFIEEFLARHPQGSPGGPAGECPDAVLAAALLAHADRQPQHPCGTGGNRVRSAWRLASRPGRQVPGRRL